MKLGIMQPYFLPYIGYWQLMNAVDKYVVYDDVNYIKNGWINRNQILVNGQPHYFGLVIQDASPFKKINELVFAPDSVGREKLLKTITQSYCRAPFFEPAMALFQSIIDYPDQNVGNLLYHSIKTIASYLDMKTEILLSSQIQKNNDLTGKDKVLHICGLLGADEYYNAIGGQEMYHFDEFARHGIKLSFVKTGAITYKQLKNDFVPNLSILDILMFNSKEGVKSFLKDFTLVTAQGNQNGQ
jgi:hypothetical protein